MIKRYLKLYLSFLKYSLIREGQFRFNFFISMLTTLLWGLMYLFLYRMIFNHIDQVGDWNYQSLLILAATFLVVNSLVKAFFEYNFKEIARLIYYGDLDLVLLKPVSSQFFVSLRQFSFNSLIRFFLGCIILTVVILDTQIKIDFLNFIIYFLLIIQSLFLVYSLWFLTLNLVFLLGNIENIYNFFHPFLRFTVIPLDVLPSFMRAFFFFVFPLIFVVTIPVKALIGMVTWTTIGYGFFITFFLLYLSHRVWQHNLKSYASASS